MIKNIFKKLSIIKRKIKSEKKSYSFGGVDLLVNYLFKNQKNGIYLDVGAQHPISNNNTYLLHKRGWYGINIDLDEKNIELFNLCRKKDLNIAAAVSSKQEIKKLFFYHDKSPINTIEEKITKYQTAKVNQIKNIETTTLNKILDNTNFGKINYMNIDVEGHELDVLKGFNLKKFKPDVLTVEYLDIKLKKLEFRNNSIDNVIDSELYKHIVDNDYSFINWSHGDLIFVNNSFRDT